MIIILPPPSPKLHAHAKGHWRTKAAATKAARAVSAFTGRLKRSGKPKCENQCGITYRFFVPDKRVRDSANLVQGCKPYIDGLVDAGVIYRDDWQWLHTVGISVEVDRESPRVELTITEVENDAKNRLPVLQKK